MKLLIQLFLIPLIFAYKCPPPRLIPNQISFDKVVVQEPFPYPFNGIDVFNGVKTQNKGICNATSQNCTLPTKKEKMTIKSCFYL